MKQVLECCRMLKMVMVFFICFGIGMNQAGLAECIVRAISTCHSYLQPVLYQR